MCNGGGFHRESLIIIKAFYIHFSSHNTSSSELHKALHHFLTLRFLPRMNRDPIQIDGSITRLGAPRAPFLTLHRLLSADKLSTNTSACAVYGSRDRIKASEGDKFEIYYGDAKVLKGAIRKDEQGNLKLDCKRGLDGVDSVREAHVEVAVDVDGDVEVLSDKVEMRRKRKPKNRLLLQGLDLEEIPEEEGELEYSDDSNSSSCSCDCDCGGGRRSSIDEEDEIKMDDLTAAAEEEEMELENVRWAVDAAILVVSLGIGFLVSRASCKNLIRRQWKSLSN